MPKDDKQKEYENIVIGAGASGLMFAAHIANKKETLLLEGNSKVGAKIEISGGGRCNFTNKRIDVSDYLADKFFIEETLWQYSNSWLIEWFKSKELEYTLKNEREYFCKKSSQEVLAILKREIRGVTLISNCRVKHARKEGESFSVETNKGRFFAKRLIVASGGLTFPKLGASGIGYEIAKNLGHTIAPTRAALVGFTLQPQDAFFKELSGVSVEAKVKVANREFQGSLLFAHKGLSGPVVLNASLFWQKGHLEIDFMPNFNLESIRRSSKQLSNLLPLPKRVAKAFLAHLSIEDRSASMVQKSEWDKLSKLKQYRFAPAGTFGFSKAEVTKGGVSVDEIDKETFMSKKEENLYFLGEVMDVTGRLGGFNFQWAFASAAKCARNLNNI